MAEKQQRISSFFRDKLGAPFKNQRWSWGAENINTGQVFLRLWSDDTRPIDGQNAIWVSQDGAASSSPGMNERRAHVSLLRNGREGYGVLCERASNAQGPSVIASFDEKHLLRLGPLIDRDGRIYALILARQPSEDLRRRWAASDSFSQDIESIWSTAESITTKKALTNARIGQGAFRAKVLKLWNDQCCVSGSLTLDVVRASHIMPWKDCTNQQRLDPHNGLPLTATLDALFDAGLLSFDGNGDALLSRILSQSERELLGLIGLKLKQKPGKRTAEYLEYHRAFVWLDRTVGPKTISRADP
jgi:putative restriction endonuclease